MTNTGNGQDTFNLSAESTQGWTVTVSADPTLAPGITATITITLTVPEDAMGGATDVITVTDMSEFDPTVWATAMDTVTVGRMTFLYLPMLVRSTP